jgi:prophage regulatory protein
MAALEQSAPESSASCARGEPRPKLRAVPPSSALAILRRDQVEAETGFARSTLYLRITEGLFVQPVVIGPRAVGWPAGEVEALNAARIAGMDEENIRRLVKRLQAARRSHGAVASAALQSGAAV